MLVPDWLRALSSAKIPDMEGSKQNKDKWQSQKSSLTRDRIIIATLECIVKHGYESTTMAKIAKIAKVSQGSMQYHYSSKIDVIKAAIDYLHVKRLNDHIKRLEETPKGTPQMAHAVDVYWQQLSDGYFVAYQDLVIAARTDPELAKVLKPAYQRFVKAWRNHALVQIPVGHKHRKSYELICDIGQYQMEGLAFGRLNDQISEADGIQVLEFTKGLLLDMMAKLDSP